MLYSHADNEMGCPSKALGSLVELEKVHGVSGHWQAQAVVDLFLITVLWQNLIQMIFSIFAEMERFGRQNIHSWCIGLLLLGQHGMKHGGFPSIFHLTWL